jgi:hypothetical protein
MYREWLSKATRGLAYLGALPLWSLDYIFFGPRSRNRDGEYIEKKCREVDQLV